MSSASRPTAAGFAAGAVAAVAPPIEATEVVLPARFGIGAAGGLAAAGRAAGAVASAGVAGASDFVSSAIFDFLAGPPPPLD